MLDLVICVFGCLTKDYYIKQIDCILNTWGKLAKNYSNVKVLFFVGEKKHINYLSDDFIYLPISQDDMLSASEKQWKGLKYIYENYPTKFVHVCGTDTYPNIPKLLKYLEKFNYNDNLYIGGHGSHELIENQKIYFHSGGSGFIISNLTLQLLYPHLDNIFNDWLSLCSRNNLLNLKIACDVSMAYYLNKLNATCIKVENLQFRSCNYLGFSNGYNCHANDKHNILKDIIVCHYMSEKDFYDYTIILQQNNYFIN